MLQVTIQEVRRLQQHGISDSELECYRMALRRDNVQACMQADAVPSHQNLEFLMEYLALGSTYLDNSKVWSAHPQMPLPPLASCGCARPHDNASSVWHRAL